MSSPLLLAIVSSLAFGPVQETEEWPSFRGPGASGVADGNDPATAWDVASGKGVRWRTPIEGLAHSSPIVWGTTAYLTTAVSSEKTPEFELATSGRSVTADTASLEWKLVSLDTESGDIRWARTAVSGLPETKRHLRSSPCNATPATNGAAVAAILGSQLYCYTVEGDLAWKVDLGVLDGGYVGRPEYEWGHASSPIFFGDLVIVQIDKVEDAYIAAFHSGSGDIAWKVARDELPTWSTPTVFESELGPELIAQGGHSVRGYDPRTGNELWRFKDHAEVKVPTPLVSDGKIYLAGGAPRGRSMFALPTGVRGEVSLDSDTEDTDSRGGWRVVAGGPYTVTPIVYRGYFYACSDTGMLGCYNATSGERIYQERLKVGVSASPIAAAGRIYFATEEGEVIVIAAGPTFELLAQNDMGDPCMATPALKDDVLFIRTMTALFAIET